MCCLSPRLPFPLGSPSGTTRNEHFHGQTKLLKNPNNLFALFCLVTALISFRNNVSFAALKRLWLVLMVSQACDWHVTFKYVGVILHIPKTMRKIALNWCAAGEFNLVEMDVNQCFSAMFSSDEVVVCNIIHSQIYLAIKSSGWNN